MSQLSLFNFEVDNTPVSLIPQRWQKTYQSWRGEFEIIRQRRIGKSKSLNYDIGIEIYSPDGNYETLVEITTSLITSAEQEFRDTVDRLTVNGTTVSESTLGVTESVSFPAIETLSTSLQTTDDRWNPDHFGEVPRKAEGDQLTIFWDDSEEPPEPDDFDNILDFQTAWNQWESTHSAVSESKLSNDSLTIFEEQHNKNDSLTGVNTYKPAGTARGDLKYYRYSYKSGQRTKHIHIPGGNCSKHQAQANAEMVRCAIASGKSPSEIEQLIKLWRQSTVRR
jgi:hypothetical protein